MAKPKPCCPKDEFLPMNAFSAIIELVITVLQSINVFSPIIQLYPI